MNYDCLIIDDEKTLLDSTSEYLNLFGIKTITAQTYEEYLDIIKNNSVKIILLDINLENDSGYEVCKRIRQESDIPIIFISARDCTDDMILALHIGGDDYIQKPYSLSLLLAKIQVILKRYYSSSNNEVIKVGKCQVDIKKEMVFDECKDIVLKPLEKKLLIYLIKNHGRTISKEELFKNVWNDSVTEDNTLNVHIHYLRSKIELDANSPKILKTIWGVGYILVLD